MPVVVIPNMNRTSFVGMFVDYFGAIWGINPSPTHLGTTWYGPGQDLRSLVPSQHGTTTHDSILDALKGRRGQPNIPQEHLNIDHPNGAAAYSQLPVGHLNWQVLFSGWP